MDCLGSKFGLDSRVPQARSTLGRCANTSRRAPPLPTRETKKKKKKTKLQALVVVPPLVPMRRSRLQWPFIGSTVQPRRRWLSSSLLADRFAMVLWVRATSSWTRMAGCLRSARTTVTMLSDTGAASFTMALAPLICWRPSKPIRSYRANRVQPPPQPSKSC